jgi:hypothetical protein
MVMSDAQKLEVVTTAKTPEVASMIVQALKFEGIPAYVGGCLLQDPHALTQRVLGRNCVDIQVPSECLEEANKVLEIMREAGRQLEEVDGEP